MRQLGPTVLALTAMTGLTGCVLRGDPVPPGVRNLTDEVVEVYIVSFEEDGGDRFLFEVPVSDDRTLPPEVDCRAPLEARTVDGEFVERRDEPLCPDGLWDIDGS
jgi:hypothetical protein